MCIKNHPYVKVERQTSLSVKLQNKVLNVDFPIISMSYRISDLYRELRRPLVGDLI